MPRRLAHCVDRSDLLDRLKQMLVGGGKDKVGITGTHLGVGLHGMGGIGKSVLAAELGRDEDIGRAFPDGVIWVDVGRNPQITECQAAVAEALQVDMTIFENQRQGQTRLSRLLADKSCLLILDDVWQVSHVEPFDALGPDCRMLITTRDERVVTGTGADICRVDILGEEQALELLRRSSQTPPEQPLPPEANDVAKECGYLPLALAMVGAMVRHKPVDRWEFVLERLRDSDLEKIKQDFLDYPYPDLFKALHVSVEALPHEFQARYLDLAVFPQNFSVPEAVFETFWQDEDLPDHDPAGLIDLFVENSLAHRRNLDRIFLHDLQFDYVLKRAGDLTELSNRLLGAYAKRCSADWATGPDDGYYHRYLVYHLVKAQRPDEAKQAAAALLLGVPGLHPGTSLRCFSVLGEQAKDIAKKVIKDTEAHPWVQSRCLKVLGKDAKDDAKRLLKESKAPGVLCVCLDLLGAEAEDDARRLLKESKDQEVLCRCLDLLGAEAEDDARRLLKESKDQEVLCVCLDLLGDEAKADARRLLKESKDHQVLCRCLDLLGAEAKADARRLLKESKNHEVLCRCVGVLGDEAQSFAIERIRNWKQTDNGLLVRCFQVAGAAPEAREPSQEILRASADRVPARVRAAGLRAPFDSDLRAKRANEVLSHWQSQYRPLVSAALTAYWNDPDGATDYCRAILWGWMAEINYQITNRRHRYDGHIIKALTHPALREEATQAAHEMLVLEATQPGFLSMHLEKWAKEIVEGIWPPWTSAEEEQD